MEEESSDGERKRCSATPRNRWKGGVAARERCVYRLIER
jgi:hypothetical protein